MVLRMMMLFLTLTLRLISKVLQPASRLKGIKEFIFLWQFEINRMIFPEASLKCDCLTTFSCVLPKDVWFMKHK